MTRTRTQAASAPAPGPRSQEYGGVEYHYSEYQVLSQPQAGLSQFGSYYGYAQQHRPIYHASPFHGEGHSLAMPQTTVDLSYQPYEAAPRQLHLRMPDYVTSSTDLFSDQYDNAWPTPESSDWSPPVHSSNNSPELRYMQVPAHHRTISMTEVQPIQDSMPDPTFDIERTIYRRSPDLTSFEPSAPTATVNVGSPEHTSTDDDPQSQDDNDSDYVESKNISPRRSTVRSGTAARRDHSRVTKRTAKQRRSPQVATGSPSSADVPSEEQKFERPFHCTLARYGCDSTFGAKNEWKRHDSTQHMRLGYWQCDQCPAGEGKKSNIYNRKDLFVQHVRRMHTNHKQRQQKQQQQQQQQHKTDAPKPRKTKGKQKKRDEADQIASDAAVRCYKRFRSPPTSSICVVCQQSFNGSQSWDMRMEHMGKHFEGARKNFLHDRDALHIERWHIDYELEEWMLEQGILVRLQDGSVVVADGAAQKE